MLRSGPYTNCRFTLSCMTEGYLSRNDFLTRCVTKSRASKLMGYMCLSADTISSYKSNSTCKKQNKSHQSYQTKSNMLVLFLIYLTITYKCCLHLFCVCLLLLSMFFFLSFFFLSSFLLSAALFSSLFFSSLFLFCSLKTKLHFTTLVQYYKMRC